MRSGAKLEGYLLIKTDTSCAAVGEQSDRMKSEWMESFTKHWLSTCYYTVHGGQTTKHDRVCTFLEWVAYRRFLSLISVFSVNTELTSSLRVKVREGIFGVWGERKIHKFFFLKVEKQTQQGNVVWFLDGVKWHLRIMAVSLKWDQ